MVEEKEENNENTNTEKELPVVEAVESKDAQNKSEDVEKKEEDKKDTQPTTAPRSSRSFVRRDRKNTSYSFSNDFTLEITKNPNPNHHPMMKSGHMIVLNRKKHNNERRAVFQTVEVVVSSEKSLKRSLPKSLQRSL